MARVLVTGASGFVGRHLVPLLRLEGHRVVEGTRLLGDVADESTWSRFPGADVVVHLAAKSFVPDSWVSPAAFIRANLLGTVAALQYARAQKARVVFLSSYLYGDPDHVPISEDAPIVATNPYALSKKFAEEACRLYSDAFDTSVVVLRPFNVYGPGQSQEFLIPSILENVRNGKTIRVSDVEPKRDWVYVTDLVRAISCAMHHDASFAVFNIGSGISHSVQELIDIVQDIHGTALPVVSAGVRRQGEIMNSVADITAAKRWLGWSPNWDLRQGISEMSATA